MAQMTAERAARALTTKSIFDDNRFEMLSLIFEREVDIRKRIKTIIGISAVESRVAHCLSVISAALGALCHN